MNKDITMVRFDNVCKEYRLGAIGGTTLRDEFQRFGAKIRKQADPTKKIGAAQYKNGEKFLALNGVSFDVRAGEAVGIIGHNGAGKSTLLKLLSRVTAPTQGDIWLNGRIASMLEVGTGFHPELTGRENIYMNGAILGMTKKEIDQKVEDIIDFSECRQFIDTPVKRYSSGMYVKLAFSVAAHLDSEILVMDEVLAVGDMKFQKKCLGKMDDAAHQNGRTVLYVSHNMSTIRQLCTRCIVLDHGKMIFDGDVEEAIQIYMDAGNYTFTRDIDYTSIKHQPFCTETIRFKSAHILDEGNIYTQTDSMNICFELVSKEKADHVRLQMILFHRDGTRVGKTESNDFAVDKGINQIEFAIPLKGIADGDYYYEIALISKGDRGAREKIDGVAETLPITIANGEVYGNKGKEWNSRYWGHVMLEGICLHGSKIN